MYPLMFFSRKKEVFLSLELAAGWLLAAGCWLAGCWVAAGWLLARCRMAAGWLPPKSSWETDDLETFRAPFGQDQGESAWGTDFTVFTAYEYDCSCSGDPELSTCVRDSAHTPAKS